jgi:hypothetical protein
MFLHITIGQNIKKSMLRNLHFLISFEMMLNIFVSENVCNSVF